MAEKDTQAHFKTSYLMQRTFQTMRNFNSHQLILEFQRLHLRNQTILLKHWQPLQSQNKVQSYFCRTTQIKTFRKNPNTLTLNISKLRYQPNIKKINRLSKFKSYLKDFQLGLEQFFYSLRQKKFRDLSETKYPSPRDEPRP